MLQYLKEHYDGTRILIDISKLAPLIYDSHLPVKQFVYNEGEEAVWRAAMRNPESTVGWLCAEKGDEVWDRLHIDPRWAESYSLALKTENFLIYRVNSEERGALQPARQLE